MINHQEIKQYIEGLSIGNLEILKKVIEKQIEINNLRNKLKELTGVSPVIKFDAVNNRYIEE